MWNLMGSFNLNQFKKGSLYYRTKNNPRSVGIERIKAEFCTIGLEVASGGLKSVKSKRTHQRSVLVDQRYRFISYQQELNKNKNNCVVFPISN